MVSSAVKEYLTELDLHQYYDSLVSNGVDDLNALFAVTENDLKELGLSSEHCRTLLLSFNEVEQEIESGLRDRKAAKPTTLARIALLFFKGPVVRRKKHEASIKVLAQPCKKLHAPDNPNIGFWFDGRVARHLDDDDVVEYPVVFGDGPMARFELGTACLHYFEVRVTELREKAAEYGFCVGFTRTNPSGLPPPLDPEDVPNAWSLGYSGIYFEPGVEEPSPLKTDWNPRQLKVDDRVGLLVDSSKIFIVLNDDVENRVVGPMLETPAGATDDLWPFVGLIGSVLEVQLLPKAAPACWKPDSGRHTFEDSAAAIAVPSLEAALAPESPAERATVSAAADGAAPKRDTAALQAVIVQRRLELQAVDEKIRMLEAAAHAAATTESGSHASAKHVASAEQASRSPTVAVESLEAAGALQSPTSSAPTSLFSPPAKAATLKHGDSALSLKDCRRKACRFGKACTRKNPKHLEEFVHPGDRNYRYGLVEFETGKGPEFETYKGIFDFIDTNASGYISKEEFLNCFDMCVEFKSSRLASASDAWTQVAGEKGDHINFNIFASWVAKSVGLKLPLGLEKQGAKRQCRFVPPGGGKPCECINYEAIEDSILCQCGHKSSMHRSDQAAYTCSKRASFSIIRQPTLWDREGGLIEVTDEQVLADLQELLVKTHKEQDAWTRDRGCSLHGVNGCSLSCASKNRVKVPAGYKLHKAFKNQNADLWRRYTMMKTSILADCAHSGSDVSYEAKHVLSEIQFNHDLDPTCNEWRLFHGSSWDKCRSVCKTNFSIDLAGTGATWKAEGTADKGVPLYGYGIYFAENITKADEYSGLSSLGRIVEQLERDTDSTAHAKGRAKTKKSKTTASIAPVAITTTVQAAKAKALLKATMRPSLATTRSPSRGSPRASASPTVSPLASPRGKDVSPKAAAKATPTTPPMTLPRTNDVCTVLLCRVVGGKSNLVTTNEIDKEKLWGDVFNGLHHSVFGDRVIKLKKPYREFVVYDKDQVYPEFLLIYERL